MTDREKTAEFLNSLDIGFEENKDSIRCVEGAKNVTGYPQFFTEFLFLEDGGFVSIGAFE